MPAGDIETYHETGQWHNRVEGQSRPIAAYATKNEAIEAGRMHAVYRALNVDPRGLCEHIIKRMDGTIESRQTYPRSADPRRTPG